MKKFITIINKGLVYSKYILALIDTLEFVKKRFSNLDKTEEAKENI